MSVRKLSVCLLAVSALTALDALAQATPPGPPPADVVRGETVEGRPRPDYDPVGIRLGGFMLLPSLSLQESYNSNIFATESDEESDFITSIEPAIRLASNWNNHALNFAASARDVRFADNNDEDFTDYTLEAGGRLDVQRDLRLFGGAGYQLRHESRSSPNDQGGSEPTEYSVKGANLGVEKQFNRLIARLDARFDRYKFEDVQAGNTVIDQGDRDRDQTEVALRTGYELAPLREIYLLTSYNWRDYDQTTDRFGLERSSEGYLIGVGTEYDLTGVTLLDGFIGYRVQEPDDPQLEKVAGWAAGLKLTWNITRLTTLTGTLEREVEEAILANASGYFASHAGIRADHELLRNLILNASIAYENDDFEGIDREDDYYLFGAGAKYLLNRNFALSGGYGYRTRSSNVQGADFDENVVFLRITGQL